MASRGMSGRMPDEATIRMRIQEQALSLKHQMDPNSGKGQDLDQLTKMHIGEILQSTEFLVGAMNQEWATRRHPKAQKKFVEHKMYAQLAFSKLTKLMQAVADLALLKLRMNQDKIQAAPSHPQAMADHRYERKGPRTKPRLVFSTPSTSMASTSQIVPEPLPRPPPTDISVEPPLRASPSETSLFKDEPYDPAFDEVKEEPLDEPIESNEAIKEEELDAMYPEPIAENFSDVPGPVNKIPKLEEPETITVGVAARTSTNALPTEGEVNFGVLRKSKVCHFCKNLTAAKFAYAIPTDLADRRDFLIKHLICETQEERNEREVLLTKTNKVLFCSKHVTIKYVAMHRKLTGDEELSDSGDLMDTAPASFATMKTRNGGKRKIGG